MPETDVIFKFIGEDELTATIDKIKASMDKVTGDGASGGVTGAAKFAKSTEEATFWSEQLKELSAGIGYNIGLWNIGMMASQALIEGISTAFEAATSAQEEWIHIQKMSQTGSEATSRVFDDLKKSSSDWGQNLEKTIVPAFNKLVTSGMGFGEAKARTDQVAEALHDTGINLTDIIIKADQGTASFADMAAAGRALKDPAFADWARQWEKATAAEADYNRELQRNHVLMERAREDADRLASAHEGFAQETGLAQGAFEAFQKTGARGGTAFANIPTALANLPGGTAAFSKLLGEMQGRFRTGIEQIAKEENLPKNLVQAGVAAGLPGFDQKSVLAAEQRFRQEANTTQQRKEQDTANERIQAFDTARINGNKEINRLLDDQITKTKTLAKESDSLGEILSKVWKQFWPGVGLSLGQVGQGLANPAQAAGQAGGAKDLATESSQDKTTRAIEDLTKMLQGT